MRGRSDLALGLAGVEAAEMIEPKTTQLLAFSFQRSASAEPNYGFCFWVCRWVWLWPWLRPLVFGCAVGFRFEFKESMVRGTVLKNEL